MPPFGQSSRQHNGDAEVRVVIAGDVGGWQERFERGLQTPGFLVERRPASPDQLFPEARRVADCVVVADQEFLTSVSFTGDLDLRDVGGVVPILAVAQHDTPETCESLLRMGCSGVVAERVVPSRLRRAVRSTACGELWVRREVMSKLVREYLLGQNSSGLTPRECEILGMIASGQSNRQIAEKLFISRETVRWHVRSLYAKTGVRGRASLASYSLKSGSPPLRKGTRRAALQIAASSRA